MFNIVHNVTANNVGSKTLFNPGFINILAVYTNKHHSRLKICTVKNILQASQGQGPGQNKKSYTAPNVKKTPTQTKWNNISSLLGKILSSGSTDSCNLGDYLTVICVYAFTLKLVKKHEDLHEFFLVVCCAQYFPLS